MKTEEWKVYKEATSTKCGKRIYEVSNYGRLKINGVITEPKLNKWGYKVFASAIQIHRAVAQLFIPNPENKPCIDHIDTNKLNNVYTNLRWVTYRENMNNPLTKQKLRESLKGRIFSDEHKKHLSEALKGKTYGPYKHKKTAKMSEEHKEKIRESMKLAWERRRQK